MAHRPRVGVTGNGRRWAPSWWCTRFALWVLGAAPVRISRRHSADPQDIDALVIGGGNDIGPEQYGGETDARAKYDPARDKMEIQWIRAAIARGIPLLGICRGAQLINVVLGGSLYGDISHLRKSTHNRPTLLPRKPVAIERDSLLARVCTRTRLRVNSLHHQAIQNPGESLRIVARDRDNLCQGIECAEERSIIGVQWHPEYLAYLPSQLALFRWLLQRADGQQAVAGVERPDA